jgi:hypothetical protein
MSINWGLLKAQGRVKDINVPWTEEEVKAIYEYKIPAELVRQGVLTPEEHEEELQAPKDDFKILRSMTKVELQSLASDLGLTLSPGLHRLKMISLIKNSKLPVQSKEPESLES